VQTLSARAPRRCDAARAQVLQLLQGPKDSGETATFLHSKGRVLDISESAGAPAAAATLKHATRAYSLRRAGARAAAPLRAAALPPRLPRLGGAYRLVSSRIVSAARIARCG
jgi:hypothetical protein